MKKAIAIFLLGLLAFTLTINESSAQRIDSLKGVWNDTSKPDTVRLEAIKDFAWDGYVFRLPDSAFYYAQLQYDFAESKGEKKYMAYARNTQGVASAVGGNYEKAKDYFLMSLAIQEELNDKKGIANALGNVGLAYQNLGDFANSLDYNQRSLKMQEEVGNKSGTSNSLNNIGLIYYNHGDYDNALDHYQRSLEIQKEIGGDRGIANASNNIGLVYYKQGDYEKAIEFYERSLEIQTALGDKRGIASTRTNIGLIYNKQLEFEKAMEAYQSSLQIQRELKDQSGIANSMNNIGLINIELKNYSEALKACQVGLEVSKSAKLSQKQRNASNCLYKAHKALGNGTNALTYLEEVNDFDKSLKDNRIEDKLKEIEFQKTMFQDSVARATRLRDEQIALEAKIDRRNSLQYTGISICILIFIVWWFFASKMELPKWVIELSLFVPFLVFFRFMSMLTYPFFENLTGGEPFLEMIMSIVLAGIITPTHSFFERLVRRKVFKIDQKVPIDS